MPPSLPLSYRAGAVLVDPNVVLAPMEGITDLPLRRLLRRIGGIGLTCTEFVPASALRHGGRPATLRLDPGEHPVAVQLYGRDPEAMAEAARAVAGLGADVCDLNMGCPSKRVCARSGGAALMRQPKLAAEIVRSVRRAVSIPVTVKMRAGFDREHVNAPEIARVCQEEGAGAVTVHWRTRDEGYGGSPRLDVIARTVDAVTIPVIGNGDLTSVAAARAMLEQTRCAGLMVGRGALRDPWLPLRISRWLRGEPEPEPSGGERWAFFRSYAEAVISRARSPSWALGRLKMLARHQLDAVPRGAALRDRLMRARSPDDLLAAAEEMFAAGPAEIARAPHDRLRPPLDV